MKKIYTAFLTGAFLLGLHSDSDATIIYVRAAATGANNGMNWTDAFTDLQAGFGATLPGDTIWLAAGVYKPTTTTNRNLSFALPDGVKILGGFNGTETNVSQRNFVANVANLSGDIGVTGNSSDNSYHVVTTAGVSNGTVLDGVRILSGNANGSNPNPTSMGGGIYNSGGSPVFRNCTVQSNSGLQTGAAHQTTSGTLTFISCTIINNTATGNFVSCTGGIGISNGTVNIYGCSLTQNSGYYGGAINLGGGSVNIDRSVLSGNTASESGGAIYGYQNDFYLTITNSLIVGNLASNGGSSAVYCVSTPAHNHRMINCTVADNRASSNSSSATIFGSTSQIDNSLFHNNSESTQLSGSNITTHNCKITGINLTNPYFISPGHYSMAPFAASGYDYHAAAFSDVIDYGSATYVLPAYNLDLGNTPRVQGPAPDCGCYENSGCTFSLSITSPDSTAICSGNTTTLSASSGSVFLWGDNSTGSSITTNTAGTYTLVADSAGCYDSAAYTVTLITASVNIGGPAGFCPGDSVTLIANGTNVDTYAWSNGDTTSSIVVSAGGTYSVTITTTAGCTASASVNLTAYAAANPVVTYSYPNVSTTTPFATYQWLLNGTPIGGATAQQHTVLQNGDYTVIVTTADGCSDTSGIYTILNVGMNASQVSTFSVYPNPCTNFIQLTSADAELSAGTISVRNVLGQFVNVTVTQNSTGSVFVDVSTLDSGLYFLIIADQPATAPVPFTKQ